MYPVTQPGPPAVSYASTPGSTFQAAPAVNDYDGQLAQGMTPAGMEIGMLDGSVRVIAAGVAEPVYWAQFTPKGGETDNSD